MRVSIGIPFYNSESTLVNAIRSVYAQTFQDWELILVDDGSTDGSLAIAQEVAQADSRVRVISDGCNKYLPYRLNQIASLALGEYLARMDSDDLMHPERLERQVKLLDACPEIAVVSSGAYIVDQFDNVSGVRGLKPLDTRPETILAKGLVMHPTITGHASWFRDNLYDESPAFLRSEDHELWCRSCEHTIFFNIAEPLYFYREVGIVTNSKYFGSMRAQRNIFRKYGPSIVGNSLTEWLILKTYIKCGIYAALSVMRLKEILVKNRSTTLNDAQYAIASSTIRTILETQVPGMD